MNRALLSIFLLLLGGSYLSGQAYQIVAGEAGPLISITFPEVPERSSDTTVVSGKAIYSRLASASHTSTEGETYFQSYTTEYPSGYAHSDSSYAVIEAFINSSVATIFADSNFTHLNTKYLFQNGFPGKEFRFKVNSSGGLLIYQVYLVGSRLIEIAANAEGWFQKAATDFFASFQIAEELVNTSDYGFNYSMVSSYSINFPADPEVDENLVATELGPVFMRMEILNQSEEGEDLMVYFAQEAHYPDGFVIDSTNRETIYDNSVDGAMQSSNGEVLWQEEMLLAGHKGRQIMASMVGGSLFGIFQMVIVEKRLYMIGVMSAENKTNAAGERFLDSFKLKE